MFNLGHFDLREKQHGRRTEKKKESPVVHSHGAGADSTSDDSVSSEGDVEKFGNSLSE